ncbi:hypothetical protein [Prevotella intermedia]|uniref:Uncharacterized protein n=1 Tax=Prevotella intermedia TaxID=28131 RepID=A0A2G8I8A9_PREIN|nr:hypothetical protein [Prevotella intermedia]PIK19776.1 hypothetical protein CTI18_12990 [Prevotella intermedia]
MENIPNEIYLVIGLNNNDEEVEDFNELDPDNITWSEEQIFDRDILYKRVAEEYRRQPTSKTMNTNKIIEDYPQLIWVQSYEKKVALSVVGIYEIGDLSEQESGYELGLYSNLSIDEEPFGTRKFDTEEEAKQAAEADYRLRLHFHLNHIKNWYERRYGL